MAICCSRGVAPTRKPVLRSCEVVPPFEAAMHTTAATVSAVSVAALPVWPNSTKTRQVNSSVATVMPEIGLRRRADFAGQPRGDGDEQEAEQHDEQRADEPFDAETQAQVRARPPAPRPAPGCRRCTTLQRQVALGARHARRLAFAAGRVGGQIAERAAQRAERSSAAPGTC